LSRYWNAVNSHGAIILIAIAFIIGALLTYWLLRHKKLAWSDGFAVGEFLVGLTILAFGLLAPGTDLIRGSLLGVGGTVAVEAILNAIRERRKLRENKELLSLLHTENEQLKAQIESVLMNPARLGTAHDLGFFLAGAGERAQGLFPQSRRSSGGGSDAPTSEQLINLEALGEKAIQAASMLNIPDLKVMVQSIVADMQAVVNGPEVADSDPYNLLHDAFADITVYVVGSLDQTAAIAFRSGQYGGTGAVWFDFERNESTEETNREFISFVRQLCIIPEALVSCTEHALALWLKGECKAHEARSWHRALNFYIGSLGRNRPWKEPLERLATVIVKTGASPIAPENLKELHSLLDT